MNPANGLLSERSANEAYLAADPGRAYALYFPDGGSVRLALPAHAAGWEVHWIDIGTGDWGPRATLPGGGSTPVSAPGPGNWAAAVVPGS